MKKVKIRAFYLSALNLNKDEPIIELEDDEHICGIYFDDLFIKQPLWKIFVAQEVRSHECVDQTKMPCPRNE